MKLAIACAVLAISTTAWAHKPSDAHVQIAVVGDQLTGTIAVALRDLDGALDLDADGNGEITWAETLAAAPRIAAYARARLTIGDGDAPCPIAFGAPRLADFSDGAYWTAPISGSCGSAPQTLVVTYGLLFDIDAQHRGIVKIQSHTVVARNAKPFAIDVGAPSAMDAAVAGASRVPSSAAELVFLACLILPLVRTGRRGLAPLGPFVLAGTAMLLMSAAELVYLPPEIAAPAVAVSIAIAAASNLVRVGDGRRDLAFELGLLQGLGYVAWLRDAGFATHQLAPVLAFALGIALAQLAIVAAFATALYTMRRTLAYRTLLWGGSSIAALGAVAWTAERWLA